MVSVGRRGRWGLGIVAGSALILAGVGLGWAWTRPSPGPLTRGRAAYDRGDWREAGTQAARWLKDRPDDPEALRLLARTAARQGRDESARGIYLRLGPEAMEAEDYCLMAVGLLHQGEPDLALGVLERARKVDPNHAETLHELARLYVRRERPAEAARLAHQLVKLPGWEARGNLILGLLSDHRHDPSGSAEALGRALRLDPTLRGSSESPTQVRKVLARDLLGLGRAAEARAQLEAVLAQGPDAEASWLLSRALLEAGSTAEATAALGQAGGFGEADPTAPEPAPFVGSARCADCHRDIHRAQQTSRHARTFARASDLGDLPLPDGKVVDPGDPRVHHRLRREGERMRMETEVDGSLFRSVVDYALGSGHRGLSLVGHDEESGQARELRMSRFSDGPTWDLTFNHVPHPGVAEHYLGRPISREGVVDCLHCHTSNGRSTFDRTGPESLDHGIGCERCHGPGGNHLKAVAAKFPDPAIARPQLASAAQVVALCGQCHSSPRGLAVAPTEPSFIRFQATTFVRSRCYTEGGGSFSCTTCHDPHHNTGSSIAAYEARCLSCHAQASTSSTPEMRRVPCPVNPVADCIRCHMPTDKTAVPHTTFTDHFIRVHRAGEK